HNNAADDERNQSDRSDDRGNRPSEPVHLAVHRLDIDESEIIVLIALELVMDTKRKPALFERAIEHFAIVGFPVNLQRLDTAEHAPKCCQRNVCEIVERLS